MSPLTPGSPRHSNQPHATGGATDNTPILQLRSGQLAPLGDTGSHTGIYKQEVDSAFLGETGLEQDEQGDKRHHGGPEKALHHFASEHYTRLSETLPPSAAGYCQPGAFGENLVTQGLTEADVCAGDIFRLGQAIVQVSQPRQPCWRLNVRFELPDMSFRFQNTQRTGWYYRVLQPGRVHQGDALILDQRPHPDWPLSRILKVLYQPVLDQNTLTDMTRLEEMSPNLRQLARKRLETRQVEDWNGRLYGPTAG